MRIRRFAGRYEPRLIGRQNLRSEDFEGESGMFSFCKEQECTCQHFSGFKADRPTGYRKFLRISSIKELWAMTRIHSRHSSLEREGDRKAANVVCCRQKWRPHFWVGVKPCRASQVGKPTARGCAKPSALQGDMEHSFIKGKHANVLSSFSLKGSPTGFRSDRLKSGPCYAVILNILILLA